MSLILPFHRNNLTLSFVGAMSVLSGIVLTDRSLDNSKRNPFGTPLFVAGWLILVYASSLKDDNTFDHRLFIMRGVPALFVMAAAMYAQTQMSPSRQPMMGFALFAAAWMFWAVSLGWHVNEEDKLIYDAHRAVRGVIGAILIVASMMVLIQDRAFNAKSGFPDRAGQTYSFGLPLFVLGWLFVVTAIDGEIVV